MSSHKETLASGLPYVCLTNIYWLFTDSQAWTGWIHREWSKHQYQFPVAALTNDHKLSGLQQYKWTASPLWKSEVWKYIHWAKFKVLSRWVPLRDSRISFPYLSQLLEVSWVLQLMVSFSILRALYSNLWLSPYVSFYWCWPSYIPFIRALAIISLSGLSGKILPSQVLT